MNKEEIGITASKKDDFSEWYTQVVLKAELADYAPVKGLIVLRPSGYSIWESLKTSLDKKLASRGVSNGFLPILIPESLLGKEKKHFAGFDPEVFWVTHSGKDELGDRLALRDIRDASIYNVCKMDKELARFAASHKFLEHSTACRDKGNKTIFAHV